MSCGVSSDRHPSCLLARPQVSAVSPSKQAAQVDPELLSRMRRGLDSVRQRQQQLARLINESSASREMQWMQAGGGAGAALQSERSFSDVRSKLTTLGNKVSSIL